MCCLRALLPVLVSTVSGYGFLGSWWLKVQVLDFPHAQKHRSFRFTSSTMAMQDPNILKRLNDIESIKLSLTYKLCDPACRPSTPDPHLQISKRSWETVKRQWRCDMRNCLPIPPPPSDPTLRGPTLSPLVPEFVPAVLQWLDGVPEHLLGAQQ